MLNTCKYMNDLLLLVLLIQVHLMSDSNICMCDYFTRYLYLFSSKTFRYFLYHWWRKSIGHKMEVLISKYSKVPLKCRTSLNVCIYLLAPVSNRFSGVKTGVEV